MASQRESEVDCADYVIVGAGSAGSVIARRLIDAGAGTVALLEAGGSDEGFSELEDPTAARTLSGTEHDWAYQTEPQVALGGRRISWPRGRGLGGSSSVNMLIYVRGHRMDYDAWEYAGCYGWGWDDVFPLFLRSENYEEGESKWHATGGPLHVSRIRGTNPISDAFIKGAGEIGIPENRDFNGSTMLGAGLIDATIREGKRQSTAVAFLRPVSGSSSLSIIVNAVVDRVVLEGDKCVGVEYSVGGRPKFVRATREVILAAGVVGSPSILMRSGIGPAQDLSRVGIKPIHDLAGVGENLHDHALAPVAFESPRALPVPKSQLMDTMLFWSTNTARLVPDMQPVLLHYPRPVEGYARPEHGYTISAGIVRPVSRGTLKLRSADPHAAPRLDPRYLSESYDLEALVDAIELSREIGNSAAFDDWRTREVAPGPSALSRADLRQYVRATCGSYHHQVGTCKMGIDDLAVVDPELRVRGIYGLRVADASIIPTVPSVNTNAPAIMIGEKASDLVLAS